jgi:hypothetical protein
MITLIGIKPASIDIYSGKQAFALARWSNIARLLI